MSTEGNKAALVGMGLGREAKDLAGHRKQRGHRAWRELK